MFPLFRTRNLVMIVRSASHPWPSILRLTMHRLAQHAHDEAHRTPRATVSWSDRSF
jgi:hypothetical protein